MRRVNLTTHEVSTEPLPRFLQGLKPESLLDLSWADPALGVQGYGWWPEENVDQPINELTQRYGAEILQADTDRSVVLVSHEVIDLTLEEIDLLRAPVIAAEWEAIKIERDRRTQTGGCPAAGKWFHSDTFSRTQILGLVMMGANIPAGLMWKTMDGSFIQMTPVLASTVFQAAAAQDTATFQAAETHKTAMEASADPASYDYSTGWPAVFGE